MILPRANLLRRHAFIGLVALAGVLVFGFAQLYPQTGYMRELTVAGGALSDDNKARDVLVVPFALLLQIVLIGGCALLGRGVATGPGLRAGLLAAVVVAGAVLASLAPGRLASGGPGAGVVLLLSLAAAFWVCAALWGGAWQRAAGHVALIAAPLTVLASRAAGADPLWVFAVLMPVLALAGGRLGERWLPAAAAAGLAGLAAVALLTAPLFWQPAATPFALHPADGPFLLAAGVAGGQALAMLWRTLRPPLVPPLCAPPPFGLALAAAVLMLPAAAPAFLSSDDYHFGETLLAAQALSGSTVWFRDFVPPHGLSDALGPLAAVLNGNATATGIAVGSALAGWVAAGLLYWRLMVRLGPVGGLCMALVLSFGGDKTIGLLNLVVVLEAMSLRGPVRAGLAGTALAAGCVLLNAGLGAAIAVAAGAAGALLHLHRGGWPAAARFAAAAALAAAAVVALFWPQIAGAFAFLRVSGLTNLTIYGNDDLPFLADLPLAFLYGAAPLVAVLFAGRRALPPGAPPLRRLGAAVVVAGPVTLLALLLNAYAAGRLDTAPARAVIASSAVLVFLPVWFARLFADEGPAMQARAGIVFALLLGAVAQPVAPLWRGGPLLPPVAVAPLPPVSAMLPRLGAGSADPAHVRRIEAVATVAGALLEDGETFLDLSNRSALYFYLNRPALPPVASFYNAAPVAFQRDFLAALGDNPPPLALLDVGAQGFDGVNLPLRSYWIADYAQAHYRPFRWGGYLFGIRRDLAGRLGRLPAGGEITVPDFSDENWTGGLASGATAATWSFMLDPAAARYLAVGDRLQFSDGVVRTITRLEGRSVATDPPLAALPAGTPGEQPRFRVIGTDRPGSGPGDDELWRRAFDQPFLYRIPAAWGRSLPLLAGQTKPSPVTLSVAGTQDVVAPQTPGGRFGFSGLAPQWLFRPQPALQPARDGLLLFSSRCKKPGVAPVWRVLWRAAGEPFSEANSVFFEASGPLSLVPLDASARWRRAPGIAEIRLDLLNGPYCREVGLGDVRLLQRVPPAGLPR